MGHAAGAGRAEIDLAGLRLGERHQLLDVRHRHVGRGDEQLRHLGDQRDQGEVFERIVEDLVLQAVADGDRAGAGDRDGVAVGLGLRDEIGAERAAGAGPVVDDHELAEEVLHLLPDHPADDVVRPAGRERHHEADRLCRIVLGPGGHRPCTEQDEPGRAQMRPHVRLPRLLRIARHEVRRQSISALPWEEAGLPREEAGEDAAGQHHVIPGRASARTRNPGFRQ